ncbi:MAG TPA: M67 family metallopeptidase [Terriglobales bacterium]|jgi:proteasome lid subunit RPN8/RPN11
MLKITVAHLRDIRRHGEEAYPEESCGILAGTFDGDTRTVHSTLRCKNATTNSPHTHYHIDPRQVIRAQRDVRERNLEIIGFYHSHPDHPARWSPIDLAEAHWIGCSYVITAVESGRFTETSSFVLSGTVEEDKRFTREDLIVGPG